MARLIYACRFEVSAGQGLNPPADEYRQWLRRHYTERRGLAEFDFDPTEAADATNLPEGHSLAAKIYSNDDNIASEVRWSFPDDTDRGLRWLNNIRIGRFDERCVVEHQIFVESVEHNIAPARLFFGSPRVVRNLCVKTPAYVGDMQVRATPYPLDVDGLDDFLGLLSSERRKLPVVFLAPYAQGEVNPLDANQLARNLAGVAIVIRATEPEVTWDFADAVGRELSCFNGAARIYWPGFSERDQSRDHRAFFSSWIEQRGSATTARTIERAIFTVATFRFVPDQRVSQLIREVEARDRQKRVEAQKASSDETWESYALELDRELEGAKEQIISLQAENANLKDNQKVLFSSDMLGGEADEGVTEETPDISSVRSAVDEAGKRVSNVEILPTAYESADQSPFQRPMDIYRALLDLDQIVEDWRKQRDEKGSGGDLLHHLRTRGWGKRASMHISDTTRGKYGGHYEFSYQGEKQSFEPHITLGAGDFNSCASIHFIFDQAREKMVIAHVGRHLPNTKT